MYGAATLSAAALLLGAIGAQAAGPPTTFKCSAAQIKCVNGKATAFLGCHNKAEGKNVPVDPACITKAEQKFTLPAKGCMDKAEKDLVKSPCPTSGSGFIALLENKSDAFVLDVVQELDPGYPAPVLSKCSAGKKKCVANKVKAVLGCYNKAAGKNLPVDPACLQKATDKFDGGADPTKGCFAKLYAKVPNDCLTPIDVAAMEAKVDAFALDIFNLTTPPPPPTILDFANGLPGGTCGSARDGSNTVIKTLHCGGLNIGGGASTVGEGPTPDGSQSRFALACVGTSCTISSTNTTPPVNSSAPDCTATGCNFGTPLPIPNTSLPNLTTCVLNTFTSNASGTLDLSTGTSSTNVSLTSTTYLTGNVAQPCPACRAGAGGTGAILSGSPASPAHGFCDRGPRATQACTTTDSLGYTRDCLTGGVGAPPKDCQAGVPGHDGCVDGTIVGPIAVDLSPLTTGIANANNATGTFCPGQGGSPGTNGCFGQPTCQTIIENGVAAGPITTGADATATLASVFCIASTANGLVNFAADLPGPGAVSLPGTFNAHN